MSVDQEARDREMRQIIGLLEKSFRIARDASLTGSMSGAKDYVIRQYNAIIGNLGERGIVLPGFFPPLEEEASFDSVGVACAQLAEYLRSGLDEGEHDHDRRGEKGRRHGPNVNINVGELKELGEIIRESLPEWMRVAREKRETRVTRERGREGGAPYVPWTGHSEPVPAPPSSAESDLGGLRSSTSGGSAAEGSLADLENRLTEQGSRIQAIAEEMRQAGLPPEDLQRLASELSRLGREQAEIAQEATARRSGAGGQGGATY